MVFSPVGAVEGQLPARWLFGYGPDPFFYEADAVPKSDVPSVVPGGEIEIKLSDAELEDLKTFLKKVAFPDAVHVVEIAVDSIGFADGTAWYGRMLKRGSDGVKWKRVDNTRAKTQQSDRIVITKPWPGIEPVKIVAVKTKNKENIEIGKAFDDDDDWLDGFTVIVANSSDKTVTAMTILLVFCREPGDTRPTLAMDLHFGPSPITREYIHRNPNKIIKPGESTELRLKSHDYKILKRDFEQTGYVTSTKRVEVIIREVGFEDGSLFDSGTFYLQDPANPHDPTKKIPVAERRVSPCLTNFPSVSGGELACVPSIVQDVSIE